MQAIIAEKASQALALAAPFPHKKKKEHIEILPCETFQGGALLTWCSGHLIEIVEPHEMNPALKRWHLETLPMIPSSFKYKVIPAKAGRFKAVKEVLKNPAVTEVIAAGDPAREGELIVQLVVRMSGVNKPMKRLWASSLTAGAVQKAFKELLPIEETMPLYYEAMARSYADWLIGMNASRAYTLLIQSKTKGKTRDVYSVGRVQTPTLALIVKREKEILNFVSKPFFEVAALFQIEQASYKGTYINEAGETRLETKEQAQAIMEKCIGQRAEVVKAKREQKQVPPPLLHSLSTLQATANKRFKFSPKKTLDVTQALYEKSFITYPRTDSNHVTAEEAAAFPAVLKRLGALPLYTSIVSQASRSILADKRYVDEKKVSDHYAIIPTEKIPSFAALSGDEQKIYDLIARSLIAAHCEAAVFIHAEIQTKINAYLFLTKEKQVIKPGWRIVFYDQEQPSSLTEVTEGQTGIAKEVRVVEGKTMPPVRYTEGELITAMKNIGHSLDDKELGKVLKAVSGLGEESTRSNIIERLKKLGYMKVEQHRVVPEPKAFILMDAVEQTLLASPELTGRWEQRLKEIGQGKASADTFIEQSKRLAEKIVRDAVEHSAQWSFERPAKAAPLSAEPLGDCPKCGNPVSDRGKFYGCTAYKTNSCNFTISKKMLGKTLSTANIKKLLKSDKTNLIKGFQGKRPFDAYIVWKSKEEGTVQFEFKQH